MTIIADQEEKRLRRRLFLVFDAGSLEYMRAKDLGDGRISYEFLWTSPHRPHLELEGGEVPALVLDQPERDRGAAERGDQQQSTDNRDSNG